MQKFWIDKAIVVFQTPEFLKLKWCKYFYAKKFIRQSDCIVPNSRIYKGEVIQVLLRKKFETIQRLYHFKPQKLLVKKRYNYFYLKRLYYFKTCDTIIKL